ncbi:adenylyltransferase/cytidyltransferase family protein [Micromonospora sp. CPCC 206061]|uniref:adenylyltransferase/cytidyltransferase family protein n=1 Tax=Micromonospora sp. CPCC 206061 TaxID=3122410 RepID=UPI002FF1C17E
MSVHPRETASRWAAPTRQEKICHLDAIRARVAPPRAAGRRVVLSQGCFDLVHLGHVRHFREARAMGDLLVVAVTEDRYVTKGPDRPLFPLAQRMEFLAELECVDFVIPSPTATAIPVLRALRPDVYVRGAEYETRGAADPRFLAEQEVVARYGGAVAFSHDPLVLSSTRLQKSLS